MSAAPAPDKDKVLLALAELTQKLQDPLLRPALRQIAKAWFEAWAEPLDDPDAELIALCDRLVQLRTHEVARIAAMDDADIDENPLEETDADWKALAQQIRQIDRPLTLEGAAAMARCVVRHSDKTPDGEIVMIDLAEWMAIRVSEFLAKGEVT
jgi:hypothetical protein